MEAKVLQSTGSWYVVRLKDGSTLDCRLPGRFKLKDKKDTNPIAVGDNVIVSKDEVSSDYVISEILKRKNYIIRQSPRQKYLRHIIASNIDQAFIMVTISQPRTSFGFIDRFLLVAEAYHIPVSIIVNKIDLHSSKDDTKLQELMKIYTQIGYKVILTSTQTLQGVEELNQLIKGKISLVLGHSGVGKSSLLNILNPDLGLKTSTISSKWQKGTHTTTFATMHEINTDTFVIDTPGVKELFVIEISPEELSGYFLEMKTPSRNCQFNNCLHMNENNCGVKEAVRQGGISEQRYISYLTILDNINSQDYWTRL